MDLSLCMSIFHLSFCIKLYLFNLIAIYIYKYKFMGHSEKLERRSCCQKSYPNWDLELMPKKSEIYILVLFYFVFVDNISVF